MTMDAPTTNGSTGRDNAGRFTEGNPGGPGSPHARKVAAWRARFVACVSEEDIEAVVQVLISAAKAGEQWAVKELLARTIGDASAIDLFERLERLEELLDRQKGRAA